MPKSTVKLKSGEIITIKDSDSSKDSIFKKRYELEDGDTRTHILRVLIKSNRGMRCMEIAKACNMNRARILPNLSSMIKEGTILIETVKGNKYYFPQPVFWNNDIIYGMYERMLPFINEINEDLETDIMEVDNETAILNCLQLALKLFSFEIEKLKDHKSC